MRRISRGAKIFGGTKKKFLWKWNSKRRGTVMGCSKHEQFLFYFILFSDFIGILFSFSFSFILDNEEACDTADITS